MSQLNGGYYGPPIPPPKSYHRPKRDSGCDCCCGVRWCCGCLFDCICGCICKILVTLLVIIALLGVVFWFIVRPNKVKFHVTDATLTQFNYTNNNLHYNLTLNITIRNPNKRLGIYYDNIEARVLYQDVRFDSENLTPFYQHHKSTNYLNTTFEGQHVMVLGSDQTSELNKDKSAGIYSIDLKMYLKIRFKFLFFKTGKFKPKINCDLKVPLKANGKSSAGDFETTKCDLDY